MKKALLGLCSLLATHAAFAQCNPNFTDTVVNHTVTFTNTTSYSGTPIPTFVLYFGDGNVQNNFYSSCSHTYNPGVYDVQLLMYRYDSVTNTITCEDTLSKTIYIPVDTNSNYIMGQLTMQHVSTNPANAIYKTWLIVNDSSSLVAIDSTIDSTTNYDAYYEFDNVQPGYYYVKSAVINGPTSGSGPLPTYAISELYWANASMAIVTPSTSVPGMNVHLQQGSVTSGPGFVGGSISAGANKGTHVTGVPVANMLVFLEDQATSNVIKYAYTDANGDYSFNNLAIGTYKVYPEEMGYQTTAWANVEVTASQTTADHVNFTEHTVSKTITPKDVSVSNVAAVNNSVNIYPNPTFGQLTINTPENAEVYITDMAGHTLIKRNVVKGSNSLNLTNLNKGIYLINVKGTHVNYTSKATLL